MQHKTRCGLKIAIHFMATLTNINMKKVSTLLLLKLNEGVRFWTRNLWYYCDILATLNVKRELHCIFHSNFSVETSVSSIKWTFASIFQTIDSTVRSIHFIISMCTITAENRIKPTQDGMVRLLKSFTVPYRCPRTRRLVVFWSKDSTRNMKANQSGYKFHLRKPAQL